MRRALLLIAALAALAAACSGGDASDASAPREDAAPSDAIARADATLTPDSGVAAEAGVQDAAAPEDAASADAARDGGAPRDAASADATAGRDAMPRDVGPPARGMCAGPTECLGNRCVSVPDVAAGWRTCETPAPAESTACSPPAPDECCTSADCNGGLRGACLLGPLWYCGGAQPRAANVCVYDECRDATECTARANGVCVPARTFGEARSRCVYGGCTFDADCAARAAGACNAFFDPCNHRFIGFFCTYADSACRSDADCRAIQLDYCAPGMDGNTSCERFMPPS